MSHDALEGGTIITTCIYKQGHSAPDGTTVWLQSPCLHGVEPGFNVNSELPSSEPPNSGELGTGGERPGVPWIVYKCLLLCSLPGSSS